MQRNARFWVWRNGWVKLTLTPGQVVTIRSGGPHDEGWSFCAETFEHCGQWVQSEIYEEGCDCDGRYSRGGMWECSLADLRARDMARDDAPENTGIFAPAWQKTDCHQRDYAAEAMGY